MLGLQHRLNSSDCDDLAVRKSRYTVAYRVKAIEIVGYHENRGP